MTNHSFYEMCDYFEFLDELRASGKTNMFGAAPFLAAEYTKLEKSDAREITVGWMENFEGDLEDRVSAFQTARKAKA